MTTRAQDTARLADLELKLRASLEELAAYVREQSLSPEVVEREMLAPFLSAVCRRSKNGSLKPKMEHLASRAGFRLRLWVGDSAPVSAAEVPNPKPQTQTPTIFSALAKAAG